MACASTTLVEKSKTHYTVRAADGTERRLRRRFKFTKASVDALPLMADGSQLFFTDAELPGFWLLVGKTTKSYYVGCDMDGTPKQRQIGRSSLYTADEARKEAREIQQQMRKGIDPREERKRRQRQADANKVTLRRVLTDYVTTRPLKPATKRDYVASFDRYLSDWLDRPIVEITRPMVAERHAEIKQKVLKRWAKLGRSWRMGGSAADSLMQLLGSLFTYATERYDGLDITVNPVVHLTRTRAYLKAQRRQDFIDEPELPKFLAALDTVRGYEEPPSRRVVCDYVELLLFTGLRRNEAAQIQWRQIDWERRFLTVEETKSDRPLVLPLTDHLVKLFERRRDDEEVRMLGRSEPWVFASTGPNQGAGHLAYPEPVIELIADACGVPFTPHDLRRTFATTCARLGVTEYLIKKLLNHVTHHDVTLGYLQSASRDLRGPMEKVTEYFQSKRAAGRGMKLVNAS